MGEPKQALPVPKVKAVSNTGPLISAFQCGRVDILERFYETLYIAVAQVPEFEKHGAIEDLQTLIDKGFITVVELTEEEKQRANTIAQRIAASRLTRDKDVRSHVPEAQAMALMQRTELQAGYVLLEEQAARLVARELGLNFTGFVGILIAAARVGLLTSDEVRAALETCRRKGTFYSDALTEEAIRRIRSGSP